MKHSHFKHIILALLLAVVIVPISLTQVTINDNRKPQQEPVKVETPNNGGEVAKEGGNKETTATESQPTTNKPATTTTRANNNSAVNAANNNDQGPKKPESLNQDYSTGSNSNNLQSHQEVEMRSYGYRILVYHTNKSKNAKTNAQKRAKDITMRFPQYQFYFTYKAPTWRLRVGDFVDEESARLALKQLKKAFPMYSKEMTIIHDNINVWK